MLVCFDDQFVIIKDAQSGFWFLPGGGVETNESVAEAAKREAVEELGLQVNVNQVVGTIKVTLVSRRTKEQLRIPPFIVVLATCIGGQLKNEYAPNRKTLLVPRDKLGNLLQDFETPEEYEWMKPYFHASREAIRQFLRVKSRS